MRTPQELPKTLPTSACVGSLLDWFDSEECAAILAQRFEPETENPFAHDLEPDPELDT